MKKIKKQKSEDKTPKVAAMIKIVVIAVVGVIMLMLTPLIREAVTGKMVENCPAYTEYGSCVLEHGLRAGAGGAMVSWVWVLLAITLLINAVYKYIKLKKLRM